LAQVCHITRCRRIRGVESTEAVYATTSLTAAEADADKLLTLSRRHWGIENRLHHVRDVSCGEDQCRTRARARPTGVRSLPQYRPHHRKTPRTRARRAFEHLAEHR